MKKILLPIVVLILLILSYFYYTSSVQKTGDALVSENPNAQAGVIVGAEIISLLEKLDRITLDTSLFSEATFQSLKDFTITLRPQEVGRPNPFAPIGTNGVGANTQNRVAPTSQEIPQNSSSLNEEISAEALPEETPASDFDVPPASDLGQ